MSPFQKVFYYLLPQLVANEKALNLHKIEKILKIICSYPSVGSHRNGFKRASFLKIYQSFLQYPLTYTKEFRASLSNQNAYSLQFVYELPSTISADLDQVCTTDHGNNLRIVHGYFINWTVHLMSCLLNNFSFPLYLSKGIFSRSYAHFGIDFNTRRYHLLTPLRKNFSLYKGLSKRNYANKTIKSLT
jgi:hypothetical protein